MRVMALDVGTRNIGVAVSDETGTIAGGRETIKRTSDKAVLDAIRDLAERLGIKTVVVGLPVNMDGTSGASVRMIREFAEKMASGTGLKVEFWDERLSSKEAEGLMIRASVSRKKRRKAVDRMAAQIILQGYLDSREAL